MKVSAIVMSLCLCAAAQAQTCFNPVPGPFVDFTQSHLGQQEAVTGRMFDQGNMEDVTMTLTLEGNECADIVVCQSQFHAGVVGVIPDVWSGDRCMLAAAGFQEHWLFPDWDTWWARVDFSKGVQALAVYVQTLSDLPIYEDTTCGTIACDNPSFLVLCYGMGGNILDLGGSDFMPQHASVPGWMTPVDHLHALIYDHAGLNRIRHCDIFGDRAELVLGMVHVVAFDWYTGEDMSPGDNGGPFCPTPFGWPCGWLPDAGAQ